MVQYTLGRTYNDVPGNYSVSTRGAGINAFPANNYDLSGEWSRADYDRRHRLNLMGTVHAAHYLDFGVGLFMNSGMPYTETTGLDEYHTGYANARPPGVPSAIPCRAPALRSWTSAGPTTSFLKHEKEGPQFTVGLDAFNVTNRVNYATYVGNLSSPFFGQAGRGQAASPPAALGKI